MPKKAGLRPRSTLQKERTKKWALLDMELRFMRRQLDIIIPRLEEVRRRKSIATGENREFHREALKRLHEGATAVRVRWEVLCSLYDIIGDTKDRAW